MKLYWTQELFTSERLFVTVRVSPLFMMLGVVVETTKFYDVDEEKEKTDTIEVMIGLGPFSFAFNYSANLP